jgi:glycosyltransferase involved in cell wall biosynthesis
MRIALFTDTFIPEVNGVARTLKRFTDFLERKQIEYKVFAPETPYKDLFVAHIHRFTSFRFFLYPECRIAAEKDVHLLQQIAKQLPESLKSNVHWLIVGDGPLKEKLQQNTPDNMTFVGYLHGEDLAKAYTAADIFVFPSPTETFGNVVLEALASGTPVIGADSGGVKNIVEHGKFGYLFEPGNVESFVHAIMNLSHLHVV